MNDVEGRKANLHEWATVEKDITEVAMAQGVLRAMALPGPSVDAFVGWMLGGLAATCALLIANVDKLANVLMTEGVVTSLCWFCLAIVFGLCAKANHITATSNALISSAVSDALHSPMATYTRERRPLLDKEAQALGIEQIDEPTIDDAYRMALRGQRLSARVESWMGERKAKRSFEPRLMVEGLIARAAHTQRLNGYAMLFISGIAVINALCFIAQPPFFARVLAWLLA
jgi:hypothetical protein